MSDRSAATALINGVEHAKARATEYSKAATKGNWQDVWASFDQRQRAKGAAANEADEEGPGLFGDDASAGVAAE